MDPNKVKAVLEWQAPRTWKQLQSFLGFANFYRQFIPSFAQIALPLTDLLCTKHIKLGKPNPKQILEWTQSWQLAFERLKSLFAQEPILKLPDTSQTFLLQADASDVAVEVVLLQKNNQGVLHPCAYTSQKLTLTEWNWTVLEKVAYTIKWALQTWRHILEGTNIQSEVWTNHKNLEALHTPCRLSPKHIRWAQYFHRFTFSLKVVPGGKIIWLMPYPVCLNMSVSGMK